MAKHPLRIWCKCCRCDVINCSCKGNCDLSRPLDDERWARANFTAASCTSTGQDGGYWFFTFSAKLVTPELLLDVVKLVIFIAAEADLVFAAAFPNKNKTDIWIG